VVCRADVSDSLQHSPSVISGVTSQTVPALSVEDLKVRTRLWKLRHEGLRAWWFLQAALHSFGLTCSTSETKAYLVHKLMRMLDRRRYDGDLLHAFTEEHIIEVRLSRIARQRARNGPISVSAGLSSWWRHSSRCRHSSRNVLHSAGGNQKIPRDARQAIQIRGASS
jgi:hypothetical protein